MKKQVGKYTTLEIDNHQDLVITLMNKAREESYYFKRIDSDKALQELLEDHLANGWDWVLPETIGALTDSPILTQNAGYSAKTGEMIIYGPVYWYPDYQVIDPTTDLFENGSITFQVSRD